MNDNERLARVAHGLKVIAEGGMIVLVDDEDREDEGDLVVAGSHCSAEHVNFMCTWGRGLICVALSEARVADLRLPMMVPTDPGNMGTAFTVSVEAREGVTTGISAAVRAQTIRVCVDASQGADDLVSPGHIFPLRAQRGGVLVRSGHTEGAVDLARLAGLPPAGVICEIMRDDGEMARMDDLEAFAAKHKLPIMSIAELIEYRLEREVLVEEIEHAPSAGGITPAALGLPNLEGWTVRSFRSNVSPVNYYLALCKGDISPAGGADPVLVRAQQARVLGDVFGFGIDGDDSGRRLRAALSQIETAGRGVFLYVVTPTSQDVAQVLSREPAVEMPGLKSAEQGFRQFGLGAQVLRALGLSSIRVMTNNPRKIIGLGGFGIDVVGSVPIEGAP
ncbi:MAG: 3,4-dihydroxy-2-butanone-4-phosphate synthase [Nannocystaceae bacterium]|nr:3,4-dihydroxy-2-butanone-4-phosphate synthase [Nannocystaceae bacterium]